MEENKEKKIKYKNPFVDESAFEGDEGPKPSEDEVLMEEAKQHTPVVEVKTYMTLGMVIGLGVGAVLRYPVHGAYHVLDGCDLNQCVVRRRVRCRGGSLGSRSVRSGLRSR